MAVTVNADDTDSVEDITNERIFTPREEYQETLIFNNAVREIFLNRFVQMFSTYEHFVIQPSQVRRVRIKMYDAIANSYLFLRLR